MDTFLQARMVEGDVVTYHRHWFIFVVKIWPILLVEVALFVLALASLFGTFTLFTPGQILLGLGVVMLISFSFPYVGYQYLDWRDDRYQLTGREVIDYDKKPFLEEKKRVAPLDHILSISHDRKGIISLILTPGCKVKFRRPVSAIKTIKKPPKKNLTASISKNW
jgi:hypothetical protein